MANINPEIVDKVKRLESQHKGLKVNKLRCNMGKLDINVR